MVAAMIPKGKMMANMLKRGDEGSFKLVKFQSSQKESPEENKVLEEEFLSFMEAGITNIRKEGKETSQYVHRSRLREVFNIQNKGWYLLYLCTIIYHIILYIIYVVYNRLVWYLCSIVITNHKKIFFFY